MAILTNTFAERASAKPTCDAAVAAIQRLTLLYTRALDAHDECRKHVTAVIPIVKGLEQQRENQMRQLKKLRRAIQQQCSCIWMFQSNTALGELTGEAAWDYHYRHWTLN